MQEVFLLSQEDSPILPFVDVFVNLVVNGQPVAAFVLGQELAEEA